MKQILSAAVTLLFLQHSMPSASAQEDCGAKVKKLRKVRGQLAGLQRQLRRLLSKPKLAADEQATVNQVQEKLGPLSDEADQLEAATKTCKRAAAPKAKPKAKEKPKKKPKVIATPKPEPVPKAPPPKKEEPEPSKAVAPAAAASAPSPPLSPPAPAVSPPLAEPPATSTSTAFPAAPPPASPEPPAAVVSACSGGPALSHSSATHVVSGSTPAPLERWSARSRRHAVRRRAVEWALEMPHRCGSSAPAHTMAP
jgi:outer membrane biosynthesis protein TonB